MSDKIIAANCLYFLSLINFQKKKREKYNFQKYFLFLKMDKNKCPFLKREFTFGKKETLRP